MGKIVIPQLSWKLLLLGAGLSAFSALSAGALVYFSSGLESAKSAWVINFLVVLILVLVSVFLKVMQGRSVRYYYLGMVSLSAHLATFLYFFLIPVFFVIPVMSFGGVIILLVGVVSLLVNASMGWLHFSRECRTTDMNILVSVGGVKGVSLKKFAKASNMERATNIFNFEPEWISKGLSIAALGGIILGFGFRKAYPEFSMLAIGLGVVYIAGYFGQLFVILFRKVGFLGRLERENGCQLMTMD